MFPERFQTVSVTAVLTKNRLVQTEYANAALCLAKFLGFFLDLLSTGKTSLLGLIPAMIGSRLHLFQDKDLFGGDPIRFLVLSV